MPETSPPSSSYDERRGACGMPSQSTFATRAVQPRGRSIPRPDTEGAARAPRNAVGVIRVAVPVDIGTIVAEGSGAFALATPLRVGELLALAVREVLGTGAPNDKLERGIRTTLAGLRAGEFVVDIDGRVFDDPAAVVICSGHAALRFFARRVERSIRRP